MSASVRFPRISLALDNCFASKRWTDPLEWMSIAREAGIYCIEASADNECDPLYCAPDALSDWLASVQQASEQTGVRVTMLYSGHGSYATLGLAHPDPRARDHMQHQWLEPMIRNAASLGAGLGFYCHAFPQSFLREPDRYHEAVNDLLRRLSEVSQLARELGLHSLSLEQMYSPHQIPWTIAGSEDLMRAVYQRNGAPLYLTIDTGHQVGQSRYRFPTREALEAALAATRRGEAAPDLWLGYQELAEYADLPEGIDRLIEALEQQHYLFTDESDGDLYAWLKRLGSYSPIIHLQQTDGRSSSHHPFTATYNANGIVRPEALLTALAESYRSDARTGLPPRCDEIYLTIEVFSSTAEKPQKILSNIRESAAYWRQHVPQDGLTLDQLI